MSSAQKTTDHDAIRRWTEARGGHPAKIQAHGNQPAEPLQQIRQ